MFWLPLCGLALAVFLPTVSGAANTNFTRPPSFNKAVDEDPSNNIRYTAGTKILVEWVTDLEEISLAYVQQLDNNKISSFFLAQNLTTNSHTWEAEYDPASFAEGKEDAIGWFTLNDPETGGPIRGSQRFNVTAQNSGSATASAVSTASLSPTNEPSATGSMSINPVPTEETTSSLSSGAIAGIAVGATIGGLLVLAGAGFLVWKRFRKGTGVSSLHGDPRGHGDPNMNGYWNAPEHANTNDYSKSLNVSNVPIQHQGQQQQMSALGYKSELSANPHIRYELDSSPRPHEAP
ncbi:hypothetical protein NM208_g9303 [Fusarium decemcellulare]|uniref:Uncharacterized protein n=1 Tax=Fusarium decemcellulare TaxID=57161 RepID=A0ACC1S243_9HYPO|nr:hypothetical protein NM208_g9303 [Fusarium decemcellulare]